MNRKIHVANLIFMFFILIFVLTGTLLLHFLVIKPDKIALNSNNITALSNQIWTALKAKPIWVMILSLGSIGMASLLSILLLVFIIIGSIDGFKNKNYAVGILYIIGAFIPFSIFTLIAASVGAAAQRKSS
ncbi:hypothetical protein OF364_00465 [Mycoplasma enhydrae]|uniref:hypothetical protein n=1 Tax=Mycoplasma enhydrae TaxID=2499220 RepID=UPI00197B7BD4|nr:hypothetical protein [Mycoplasma enhydrae]MBN4089405.1 hypothetical protein [Mycoplasma enhydrae]MCV3733461.1 hypothetical protein [Mycoplasma enhydrae]MCV3753291.1 hypothetical protein [Mycoplasma enhydrae]